MYKAISKIIVVISLTAGTQSLSAKSYVQHTLSDSIIEFAEHYTGCPYKYASKGPKSFDCSGFTGFVFSHFGYSLNSSSAAQYTQGEKVKTSKARKGDLIFFKGSNANSSVVGHVGLITEISNDTIRFIHAAIKGGVRYDTYPGYDYYNKRYVGCTRIIGEEEPDSESDSTKLYTADAQNNIPRQDTIQVKPVPVPQEKETENVQEGKTPIVEETTIKEEKKKSRKEKKRRKDKSITYTVKKGDTLYRISSDNHCTVEEIKNWNHLKSNTLQIGQKLIIKRQK